MIELSGADLVLPDRILTEGTIVIEDGRITDLRSVAAHGPRALRGHLIVPGFIDVHVHGIAGIDSLGAGNAVAEIAARLPRFGTVAFCPTTVACPPLALRSVLRQIQEARAHLADASARVLPAHLESNFLNPEFNGAQPDSCLRVPRRALAEGGYAADDRADDRVGSSLDTFTGGEILREIERAADAVGIVTLAPELDGGLDLIAWLRARGIRPALGHSGATYDDALAAIRCGATHATHLFNRMPPLDHRRPGLVGAILESDAIAAEIICDGRHVHPAVVRTAVKVKGPSRILAITDGTAASGLPVGTRAMLGSQEITTGSSSALLADGTMAGSIVTMDAAFRMLVREAGLSTLEAATMCATTPARELGLSGCGTLTPGARADLVVLDSDLRVVQTYVAGRLVYERA